MTYVLDASVAVAWLLDDENEPQADAPLARLGLETVLVPGVWHVEVRNALLGAERRGRLLADDVDERLRQVAALPVRTDPSPSFGPAFALARAHRLSLYDALYLELALRERARLATLDGTLASAALAESCPVF